MHKKVCSFVLALSIASCLISSCSKTEDITTKTPRYVEDGPWWNADICEPDLSDLGDVQATNVIAADEEYFVLHIYTNDNRRPTVVRRYNYNGELCGEIDPSYFENLPLEMFSDEGEFYAVTDCIYEVDFDNGTLINPVTPNIPPSTKIFTGINRIVKYQDKYIYLYTSSDMNGSEQVFVIDDGDNMEVYEPDFGDDVDVFYVMNMMMYGDKLVFEADVEKGDEGTEYICTFDPETKAMERIQMPEDYFGGAFLTDDGAYYTVSEDNKTRTKISRYDPQTNEFGEVLDFADTPVDNLYGMSANYHVIYADEGKVVVTTEKEGITWGNGDPVIITLTKADNNPNVGKQILEVGYVKEEPFELCQAISEFNLNNDEYYVELNGKYYDFELGTQEMADVLMSDIRSGEGPDMVILDSDFAFMNDEQYLRKADDGSYRYTYCQNYNGLIVKTSLLSTPDASGITYEEYIELIRENNNGISTLGTKLEAFNTLFKFNASSFFDDRGHIDLSGEDFRAMAEFVAGLSETESGNNNYAAPQIDNVFNYGFTGFLVNFGKYSSGYSVIGYPSRDGSLPETVNSEGIGITSCCSSEEGCHEFIDLLMSPQIQSTVSRFMDPVSEDGLRLKSDIIVAENNRHNRESALVGPEGWPTDAVDHYIEQVADAVKVPDVDTSVLVILDEEIQPYLEGQKSIDEVIDIAENRINLMIDERG